VAIILDRENGTIEFDVNGEKKGIAFKDEAFKTMELFTVVGLLIVISRFVNLKEGTIISSWDTFINRLRLVISTNA
jgi:2-keto-4-pentenoate hydratase/2-oxohepta-3-ene-1,7-dioic acid hydratase in catechol pathway